MDSINIRNTRNKRERRERSSLFSILHSWKRRRDPGSWPGQKRRTPFFDRSLSASKPRTTSYPFTAPRPFSFDREIAREPSIPSSSAWLSAPSATRWPGFKFSGHSTGASFAAFSIARAVTFRDASVRSLRDAVEQCVPAPRSRPARDAIPRLAPRSPRASVAIVARAAPRARKKTTVRETKQLRYLTRTSPISTGPRLPWPP